MSAASDEVAQLRAALVEIRGYHGNSIDPSECMECADGHFPCRTARRVDAALVADVSPAPPAALPE